MLCLVGFYFEMEWNNFSSSEPKIRSKSWQLLKINEQPCNKGVSVTLETQFQKASWSNFSFRLSSVLVPSHASSVFTLRISCLAVFLFYINNKRIYQTKVEEH